MFNHLSFVKNPQFCDAREEEFPYFKFIPLIGCKTTVPPEKEKLSPLDLVVRTKNHALFFYGFNH
jgi:hypothetical protein